MVREGATLTTVREVIPGYDNTLCYAYYEKDDTWACDINCGFQRWRGTKTTPQLRAILKKCGFTKEEIRDIIKKGKERVR
jgi:hypothetical protein